uniref:2'-5' oligoadenylate synthase n=1 Tax=Pelusios castaneus TaxID=367368 RepID=A0A8C8RC35_9SAUR
VMTLYKTPAEELDRFISNDLQSNKDFKEQVSKAIHTIFKCLTQNCFRNSTSAMQVLKVIKAGSSGKGTALKGVSDVDLVVFVKSIKDFQDLKAKRKNIIAEIRTELEQCYLGDDLTLYIKETKWDNPRVLTFTLRSETMGKRIDFDVLPAFDVLGQMRSGYKPVPEVYVRLFESSPEGNEFSCCFTELQRNFIISLPTKLKSLIRLVKHWYKQYILPHKKELRNGESLPPQYALELLSVYAWEHGGRDPAFNMARGFRTVLGLIQQYKQLRVYWTINYDFEDETLRWYLNDQLRKSRPIILDPADPTGIVGHGSCWDMVAKEAERCCGQLCCRKRDGFAVQPWDVPVRTGFLVMSSLGCQSKTGQPIECPLPSIAGLGEPRALPQLPPLQIWKALSLQGYCSSLIKQSAAAAQAVAGVPIRPPMRLSTLQGSGSFSWLPS